MNQTAYRMQYAAVYAAVYVIFRTATCGGVVVMVIISPFELTADVKCRQFVAVERRQLMA